MISGTINSQMSNLSLLNQLALTSLKLSGTLPRVAPSAFQKMIEFSVGANRISGTAGLLSTSSVTKYVYGGNHISGTTPHGTSLPSLLPHTSLVSSFFPFHNPFVCCFISRGAVFDFEPIAGVLEDSARVKNIFGKYQPGHWCFSACVLIGLEGLVSV